MTQSLCPVCNQQIPSSDIQRHVNACLDTQQPDDLDIPSPPPSDTDIPTPPSTTSNPTQPDRPISAWLSTIGMAKYAPGFLTAGYRSLSDLISAPNLDQTHLRDACGVTAMGARRKIASQLAILTRTASPSDAAPSVSSDPNPSAPKSTKRKLWAIFEPGYHAAHPVATRPPKASKPNSFSKPDASKATASDAPARQPRPRTHNFAHRVAGTAFTVDSFYAAKHDSSCTKFFLSHFHSDHYGPLRKSTLPKGSTVLCSSVTAALVRKVLCVPEASIQVLDLNKELQISDGTHPKSGASVWLFDANHCPGAVLILFHVWRTKRYVLHTGDCRYDASIFSRHAKLAQVVNEGRLDFLHLDTTYCKPEYAFPAQRSVLDAVVEAARREDKRTRGRCLFFFGTYSIGKEKVFLAVAQALNLKIYADKRKRTILEACELGADVRRRIVDNAHLARAHVVSMSSLSPTGLGMYVERNRLNKEFVGRGLAVVFKPTGWTFRGRGEIAKRVCRVQDQAIFYEVAYSEHSSFVELKAFVEWAKPRRVIPTVNAYSKESADELRRLVGHTDRKLCEVDAGRGG